MSDKQLFVTSITDTNASTSHHIDTLGDIRWVGNKCYKYVQYSTGSGTVAATAGSAVVYEGTAGLAGNIVTKDYTDGICVAGILAAAPADNEYCWIQIKGPVVTTVAFTSAPVAGQPMTIGTADGALTELAISGNAVANGQQTVGFAITTDNDVLLDCPF